nr:hypothetical protein [Tanacetum cinerariifolium]
APVPAAGRVCGLAHAGRAVGAARLFAAAPVAHGAGSAVSRQYRPHVCVRPAGGGARRGSGGGALHAHAQRPGGAAAGWLRGRNAAR